MGKSDQPAPPSPRKPKNLHANHRQRTLNRYLSHPEEELYPHQLLEILLFFSISRRDTNPTAHLLLDQFGTISNLLNCSIEELCEVKGIGPASANLIHLVGEIREFFYTEGINSGEPLRDRKSLMAYLNQHLPAGSNKGLYLLLLDGRGCPFPISVIQTDPPYAKDFATIQKVLNDIFAHGMPHQFQGMVLVEYCEKLHVPSEQDMFFLSDLQQCLNAIHFVMLDYLIMTPQKTISLRKVNLLR